MLRGGGPQGSPCVSKRGMVVARGAYHGAASSRGSGALSSTTSIIPSRFCAVDAVFQHLHLKHKYTPPSIPDVA